MLPTFSKNSFIVVGPYNSLAEGDIVTFKQDAHFITHRIESYYNTTNTYQTKGDNNDYPDHAQIKPSDIVGKVYFWFSPVNAW